LSNGSSWAPGGARTNWASLPLPHFGSLQLDKRWKKVRKGGRELAALDPETRHRLRIEVKKLRYAVEFLASLTTQPEQLRRQRSFIKALEDLQERLGELNDLETARTLLGDMLGGDSAYADALRYAGERLEPPDRRPRSSRPRRRLMRNWWRSAASGANLRLRRAP
jgi:CHAD domain-containing protein